MIYFILSECFASGLVEEYAAVSGSGISSLWRVAWPIWWGTALS